MKARALIAEDEPLLAVALKAALASAWPELDFVALAPNGTKALRLIEAERPEVAFLDIRMPGMTGLEVAAELADRLDAGSPVPRLVFVTAYDEFALKAFDLAAVDYLHRRRASRCASSAPRWATPCAWSRSTKSATSRRRTSTPAWSRGMPNC